MIQIQLQELELKKKKLQLDAADLLRKSKKDEADADLKELTIRVNAQRTGVMGRTQELAVQQQDRATAQKTQLEIARIAATNAAGSSGANKGTPTNGQ